MNLLSDGATWMFGALRDGASTTVSLRRGGNTTTGVVAIIGSTDAVVDDNGTIITSKSRDYLIEKTAYVINSVTVEPAAADVIIEGGYEYEVLPVFDQPASRDSDPYGNTIRVHTKKLGASS